MKRINLIKIHSSEHKLDKKTLEKIFKDREEIYGGEFDDSVIGYNLTSKKDLTKLFEICKELKDFLIEIKDDINNIDEIKIYFR